MSSKGSQFASNQLFDELPAHLLEEVCQIPEPVTFKKDDIIFAEQQAPDYLYLIVSGSVKISKQTSDSKQESLAYLQPNDYFGEMGIYDSAPRSSQAMAAETTLLGRIDHDGFDRLLRIAPVEITRNLLIAGARRLRRADSTWVERLLRAERLSLIGSMVGTMVHDFKDPMNVIVMAADTILMQTDDFEVKRMSKLILKYADHMNGMAQEVNDFTRGESHVQRSDVLVPDLMAELDEAILDRLSKKKGVVVERQIEYTGHVSVDIRKFPRALMNLVRNAADVMPNGGTLRLTVREANDGISFTVADTGPGMPAEMLPTIFEPFVTRGKVGGTGLGLAIVKSIVQAHDGRIEVASEVNKGTSFEIVIPRPGQRS